MGTGDMGWKAAYNYFGSGTGPSSSQAVDDHDDQQGETGNSANLGMANAVLPISPSSTVSTTAIDELVAAGAAGVVALYDMFQGQEDAERGAATDESQTKSERGILTRFRAHSSPLAALAWNPSGTLV